MSPATCANQAARRQAHDDRTGALEAIEQLGDDVDDLIETARDEVGELHLDHREIPEQCRPRSETQRAALGDRGVEHAVRPARMQPFGDPKGALELRDVLAEEDDRRIVLHLLLQGLVNRVEVGDLARLRRTDGAAGEGIHGGRDVGVGQGDHRGRGLFVLRTLVRRLAVRGVEGLAEKVGQVFDQAVGGVLGPGLRESTGNVGETQRG